MRSILFLFIGIMTTAGCAKVQVQAPKEPIKIDISMRLDVYQHVEQDIDEIENIVSGSSEEPQSKLYQNLFDPLGKYIDPLGLENRLKVITKRFSCFVVSDAYAEGGLSLEVEQAALRRRDRKSELMNWQEQGVIGENNSGLVEIRDAQKADASVGALVSAENSDRMVIYQGVAKKNGTSVGEVQKLYAKRLQKDAPSGTPIQDLEGEGWKNK